MRLRAAQQIKAHQHLSSTRHPARLHLSKVVDTTQAVHRLQSGLGGLPIIK